MGLTQRQLASATELPVRAIQDFESDSSQPNEADRVKIGRILGNGDCSGKDPAQQ